MLLVRIIGETKRSGSEKPVVVLDEINRCVFLDVKARGTFVASVYGAFDRSTECELTSWFV